MQLANFPTLSLGATSVASVTGVSNSHPLEIALALDNTGSMAPNIQALITAAQTLADTALSAAGGPPPARQRRALCRGGQSGPAESRHDRYDGAVHL